MESTGKRHSYPLVAVYAHRFHAQRFALMGDAAVGMHPVTAHGFNFGLRGADRFVTQIKSAASVGGDIGAEHVLERYGTRSRRRDLSALLCNQRDGRSLYEVRTVRSPGTEALLRVGNVVSPSRACSSTASRNTRACPRSPRAPEPGVTKFTMRLHSPAGGRYLIEHGPRRVALRLG